MDALIPAVDMKNLFPRTDDQYWASLRHRGAGSVAHCLHALGFHVFPVDHPDQPECIGKHGPTRPATGSGANTRP